MPGGNKKDTHTQTNLQLKAAGLFKYVSSFCYHQALKGYYGKRLFQEIVPVIVQFMGLALKRLKVNIEAI